MCRLAALVGILEASTHFATAAEKVNKLPPISVSAPRGFHEKPIEVSLSFPLKNAQIRYTTDGSEPTAQSGFLYSKSFNVASNTVLRVAAFEGEARVSKIGTYTYLFLEQVVHQPAEPSGFPSGQQAWNGYPSFYGMDPRVVDDPIYRNRLKAAFAALPILSVVCRKQDMFDPAQGLYVNPLQHGENWERPCSAEFILTNGQTGFQADCGIRIQGNSNRIPQKSLKHSFRLVFKSKYGPAKLHYPIFPETNRDKFDSLVLRADYNNSWVHWDARARPRAQRVRDAWFKDSQRAMGWPAGHTRFVHLFLNGLYWGIYDFTERPDANFASAYLGGKPEDYDVINEMQVKDGKMDGLNALYSVPNLSDQGQYEKLQSNLNLPEYIDYLLLHYYSGNQDIGENKNWYAIRRRSPPGPFQYLVWDGEQILQNLNDDTVTNPYETPFRIAKELKGNPEFRLAFADRVQKHFFNSGALTPAATAERWMTRAKEVDEAMIAESARWGSNRRNVPYSRDREYAQEQQRLLKSYFPARTRIVLEQLRAAGFYPNVEAPTISQSAENKVNLSAGADAKIYYTLDGKDPRMSKTGEPSPTVLLFTGPLKMQARIDVKARAFKGGTWSALTEASFNPKHP
ncbi:MAG TPA: chitobiase/beta-hexosaminidase C-terminal domain-containing protein [Candidatus Saccharimonadales bacterium]|nr:chitobiase/beta-hexosaminidase C-terminal domain-containing protein [Candidatus Saccharimonadales bacterium]